MKGNFVRKNLHKFCIPKIQQSKRRQALMAANMEEDHESDIPLDSEEDVGYTYAKVGYTAIYYDEISEMNWESFKDIGTSNIDIGDEE